MAWFSRKEYDVFLSCSKDTQQGFTSRLYDELRRRGFRAFVDDENLAKGDEIGSSVLKAIEGSRIAIVVLSQNYGSSTWCLERLTKILHEFQKYRRRKTVSVFYHVTPGYVSYQKDTIGEAWGSEQENVQLWRDALTEVAAFSGFTILP